MLAVFDILAGEGQSAPPFAGMTWLSEPATPPREWTDQVVYLSVRQTDGLLCHGNRTE
jgi:hypothetical protein